MTWPFTALPVDGLGEWAIRSVTLKAPLLFVARFTVVFTALGASCAFVGSALFDQRADWFVAMGLGYQRLRGSVAWLRRHEHRIEQSGGALLVGVEVLFVSGAWRSFFIPLQRVFARLGWPPI